ncbi:hypothetical protein V7S43_004780 [Phytophthora oleae]|uniref:Crinkler effector protein N-terminal domain-containing protein n=1 Tax=Phytophthora oleae TaxID=2107226 RepID=A0ABD3FVI9_9STRA
MEDVAMAAQEGRVVVVNCIVVGIGEASGISIESNAKLIKLKQSIMAEYPNRLKGVDRGDLQLFLAKKADKTWLSADPAFEETERDMLRGSVPNEINDIISDEHMMLNGRDTIAEALVKAPLPKWTIEIAETTAVSEYKRIADRLKKSKEVEAVVKTLKDVSKRKEPMPFVVLENSSGTGKTQMAFNLEAHGAFDVFYLPCTPIGHVSQQVYQAFTSRQIAFKKCIKSDIEKIGEGSVVDFGDVDDTERLKVYAFIIAALRGVKTFMGDALLKDVNAARDERSKPIVFFLDEFPRVQDANKKLIRSMRNVFRFLRLPLIISATNGTARNLFTVSDYSRPSSDPVPWCMVVPSLPTFATEVSATSVFKWIIRHSRPLFGALTQKHMDQFPYDGQDQLGYLTKMVKALTPEFRCLKNEDDFERGQLYLFLGASYNVDDDRGMSDDENDEDYVPEDDDDGERQEDSDEEMPEAGSDETSKKEVNLIDGHYGRMEEQEIFELQLGKKKELLKNKKVWKCRCVFPRLHDDILLFLTLMGDYEDTDAQGSGHQRQRALPDNMWSPLDRPFCDKLRDALGQNGTTARSAVQDTNDGMGLEALVVGAVVLASHQGGFYGINFKAFFDRLLYELGVRDVNKPVAFPQGNAEVEDFTIPFLSPPNVAWPDEFLAFWKDTRAQFANMERCRNGDKIDFTAHSGALTGECKDRQQFPLSMLKHVLEVIPSTTKIHLVVVKCLQGEYFTKSELVAEPKDAASAKTAASSKTKKLKQRERKKLKQGERMSPHPSSWKKSSCNMPSFTALR